MKNFLPSLLKMFQKCRWGCLSWENKRVDIQQTKSCTRKLLYDKILYMSLASYDKTLYMSTILYDKTLYMNTILHVSHVFMIYQNN